MLPAAARARVDRRAAHAPSGGGIYTFWDYFRQSWQRNAGLRIDHLLLNAQAAPRLVEAGVDRWVRDLEKPSDHAPTWVRLEAAPSVTKPRKAAPARRKKPPAR